MNKDLITLHIRQGEGDDMIYMTIRVNKETEQKMIEIQKQYPVGYWDHRGIDLYRLAGEELRAEKEQNQ